MQLRILRTKDGDRLQQYIETWEFADEDTPGAMLTKEGWIRIVRDWQDVPVVEA
jgi:hypothetical protein